MTAPPTQLYYRYGGSVTESERDVKEWQGVQEEIMPVRGGDERASGQEVESIFKKKYQKTEVRIGLK